VSLEGGILTVGSVQVPWTGDLPTPGEYLTYREAKLQEEARAVYEERLALGVAREQARKDLPLSTYTEAYWKIDLHNLFHFLSLRVDSHAQLEIQLYGLAILGMIGAIVPWSVEAFTMYRLRGLTLSMLDREAIRRVVGGEDKAVVLMDLFESKGERDECH